MGRLDDKPGTEPEETPVEEGRPGRVVVDARGRNVWQWAKAALDSTSILLKRLENKDLALEPTQKVPVMGGAGSKTAQPGKPGTPAKPGAAARPGAKQADEKRANPFGVKSRGDSGGGFDPYNSR